MRNAFRFLLVLTLGLGALSLIGYFVLERTTRRWYVTLRSQLAVAASRQSLIESILSHSGQLERILTDVPPITLLRSHHEPPEVFKLFRAADVCYLSSLHDGMNLVAKEFVAARDDEQGVLVLSQFTGAARDLTEALIVNPYDIRQAGDALAVALTMPEANQRERMRSMRRLISQFNVYRWAGRILVDAAEVRRQDRMTNRLSALQTPISSALA